MDEEMISITQKEYNDLCNRDLKLTCLENSGVDNWDWYGDAMEEYAQLLSEEE